MAKKIEYGRMLHGGDYNPEQWLDRPDILKKDIEYFKKAHINTVSVGIFSWAVLEPEEGKYNLGWLEEIIDNLYKEGIPRSWQHRQAQGQSGWPTSIRRSFAWIRTAPEDFSEEDIIIAIHLRYIVRKFTIWTSCFPRDWAVILV